MLFMRTVTNPMLSSLLTSFLTGQWPRLLCYYCKKTTDRDKELLEHLGKYHLAQPLSLRCSILNHKTGLMEYQSKHFYVKCGAVAENKQIRVDFVNNNIITIRSTDQNTATQAKKVKVGEFEENKKLR